MRPNSPTVGASRSTRVLHTALAGGLALVGVVVFVLLRVSGRPLGYAPIPEVIFPGFALIQIGVALAVLRRRIPSRRFNESLEDYWSSNEVRSSSIVLWAMLEGAGLFAWVGYLLTGGIAAAAVAVIALFVLVGVRPSRLEGEGAA